MALPMQVWWLCTTRVWSGVEKISLHKHYERELLNDRDSVQYCTCLPLVRCKHTCMPICNRLNFLYKDMFIIGMMYTNQMIII